MARQNLIGVSMLHKISQMCDRVDIVAEKSKALRELKYNTPKDKRSEAEIQFLIDDIQSLCRSIGADTSKYDKS
jgi:hypothetical protein